MQIYSFSSSLSFITHVLVSDRDTRFTSARRTYLHAALGASLVVWSPHHHHTASKVAWLRTLGCVSSSVYALLHMLCYLHLQAYARLRMLGNICSAANARHCIFGYVHARTCMLGFVCSGICTSIRKLGCVCLDTKARLRLLGYESSILSDVCSA